MKNKIDKLLKEWAESFKEIQKVSDELEAIFKCAPESKVINLMYDLHEKYTDILADKIDDKDGWLHWFLWDNQRGKRGLSAKAAGWDKPRKIKNLKDLKSLIKG